jgi:hypothetical protein
VIPAYLPQPFDVWFAAPDSIGYENGTVIIKTLACRLSDCNLGTFSPEKIRFFLIFDM